MTEKKKFHDPMAFVRASDEAPAANVAPARAEMPAKAPAALPWESAHPKVKEPFVVRLPQSLHMKLAYLAENTPESMHAIALAGVTAAVEKRLRKLLEDSPHG
jgi:hypothetical protein